MPRLALPFFICVLVLANTQANAQAAAAPPAVSQHDAAQPAAGDEQPASASSVADEVCPTLEQAAAENGLPVDFFLRVIWQESRFNVLAVSPKGAQGIAQFMPRTADWRGLGNPFDVIAALKASASYLRDLRNSFGNLGLAAAAYNAGPQRVQDWLSARGGLPKETRRYVQNVTGHSAEEWSGGPTQANLALPQPVPCWMWLSPCIFQQRQGPKAVWRRCRAAAVPNQNPGGVFNSWAALPRPEHWRRFSNFKRCIRTY